MNVAIFISRGNSPQRLRGHEGFFGGTRGHALQAVRASRGSSRCTSILKQLPRTDAEFPNARMRTTAPTNLLLPCRSWCSLCLRGEIFFLRDLVARSLTAGAFSVADRTLHRALDSVGWQL